MPVLDWLDASSLCKVLNTFKYEDMVSNAFSPFDSDMVDQTWSLSESKSLSTASDSCSAFGQRLTPGDGSARIGPERHQTFTGDDAAATKAVADASSACEQRKLHHQPSAASGCTAMATLVTQRLLNELDSVLLPDTDEHRGVDAGDADRDMACAHDGQSTGTYDSLPG